MTQIVINVDNQAVIPHLKKVLQAIKGVTISKSRTVKSGIEEAMEDIEKGRIYKAKSVDDMFKQILD